MAMAEIEGRLLAAARTLAGLTVIDLALEASVTPRTVGRIERTTINAVSPKLRHGHIAAATLRRIIQALARHGVEIIPEAEPHGAGVRWVQLRQDRK